MPLSVRMFGEFELRGADGGPIPLGSVRITSLLAYLLLNRSSHSRQRLASLLWPVITALLLAPQRRPPDPDQNRPL